MAKIPSFPGASPPGSPPGALPLDLTHYYNITLTSMVKTRPVLILLPRPLTMKPQSPGPCHYIFGHKNIAEILSVIHDPIPKKHAPEI